MKGITVTRTKDQQYRKMGKLGEGMFGSVMKAQNQKTGEIVAMKEMALVKFRQKPRLIEMLRSEIKCLKMVKHANLVELKDHFQRKQFQVMIYEYCEGGTLKDYIRSTSRVDERKILEYLKQVYSVLALLHSKNIIHRDVKPDNVLFKDKARKIIKVADLGFCSLRGEHTDFSIIGSPGFLAPEVFSRKLYSPKSDVYACGIMLYEMLTKRLPFHQKTEAALARFKQTWMPQKHEFPRDTSRFLYSLLCNMIHPNIAKRPSSATVLKAIEKRLGSGGSGEKLSDPKIQPKPFSSKNHIKKNQAPKKYKDKKRAFHQSYHVRTNARMRSKSNRKKFGFAQPVKKPDLHGSYRHVIKKKDSNSNSYKKVIIKGKTTANFFKDNSSKKLEKFRFHQASKVSANEEKKVKREITKFAPNKIRKSYDQILSSRDANKGPKVSKSPNVLNYQDGLRQKENFRTMKDKSKRYKKKYPGGAAHDEHGIDYFKKRDLSKRVRYYQLEKGNKPKKIVNVKSVQNVKKGLINNLSKPLNSFENLRQNDRKNLIRGSNWQQGDLHYGAIYNGSRRLGRDRAGVFKSASIKRTGAGSHRTLGLVASNKMKPTVRMPPKKATTVRNNYVKRDNIFKQPNPSQRVGGRGYAW